MDKAEVLKELIKKNYKSVKEFALDCNLPYTTVYTILQNGVSKANVNNVITICKKLNISVEQLYDMAKTKRNENNSPKKILEPEHKDPIIIAASEGGLTNIDERINELLNAKQELCSTIYAANLDRRQIKELIALVKAFENL